MKIRMAMVAAWAASAAVWGAELKTVGNWKISFDEGTGGLVFENAARRVKLAGTAAFSSRGSAWKVVSARDAAQGRLALANPGNTVLGYVSFRGEGDRVTVEVFHRAGANFFPGRLTYDATASFRDESFPCRTFPAAGEQVLNFADGAGDSPLNDSIFAREEDLALRFSSLATRVTTLKRGQYAVHLEADIDEPAHQSLVIEADGAYFKNRWAPGYHPIDRKRCPKAPTGWMSWNSYFDKAGSAENLAEARIGAKYLLPFGCDIWSIESWQDNSLWLPVAGFHHHENRCYARQFPEGMKALADEIRKLGFKPGIWMSLYGEGDEKFYQAHRDLYLHDKNGKPIDNWAGRYMLDTTKPEALDLIRRLARQASEEWGYEFFKFDGMANTPRKFERPDIRACAANPGDTRWFDNSVKALREGIGGDKIFLGCMGDFTGTEAQYLDASRLGADVVGCYRGVGDNYNPGGNSSLAQMPVKWQNVLHQAECTFTQIFVNNLMFYTDPDTLMVGYALETHEAEVMATIVGLPGQLMFAGDRLGTLRAERMKMIQQVLPVADIHPQNLYPYAASAMLPVWNLAVTRPFGNWRCVALFNFSDAPKDFDVPLASLGLDPEKTYVAHEFWKQDFAGEIGKSLVASEVPMRSVRLYAIREAADHPQFVGDDRHITQGAVELNDLRWDAKAGVYTLDVKAIGGFPFVYKVRVPAGYDFVSATASRGTARVKTAAPGLLAVTVAAETSADVAVKLAFAKK
ncbi:MAG: hypothetical protein ACI4Q3_07620 [Kiritimatiellia bacterium]